VPELPAAARNQDRPGAAAFVRHWFDLVNHAYRTGDTAPLKSFSHSECKTCHSIISSIEDAYSDGGSIGQGDIDVLVATAGPIESDGIALVTTVYRQQPIQVLAQDGTVATAGGGVEDRAVAFYVESGADSWTAFEVTDES
jgi:hypothetical protein